MTAMTVDAVIYLSRLTLMLGAKVALPFLVSVLAVGLLVGLFQSVTQIQEPTLTFVPKLVAVAVVLLLAGTWMLSEMLVFGRELMASVPELIRS